MKKLITILSTISLITTASLSTISCNEKSDSLSLEKQETDIINAINQYYEKNDKEKSNINDLSINDIIKVNSLSYTNNHFSYDINFKNYSQSQNIVSENYKYLNPEIKGSFDLKNNIITNNNLNSYENLNDNYDASLDAHDLLIGTTTNFYAIFDDDDWSTIYDEIINKDHPVDYINSLSLKNPNINLTDQDWTDILNLLAKNYMPWTNSGYSFLMHIVNKQVVYANINKDGTTNMPYANATEDIENNFYYDSSKKVFKSFLSKPLLLELNDLFNYNNKKLNDDQITKLITNKMWLTNCTIKKAVNNLTILFNEDNIKIINQILTDANHNHGFVIELENDIAQPVEWLN